MTFMSLSREERNQDKLEHNIFGFVMSPQQRNNDEILVLPPDRPYTAAASEIEMNVIMG